MERIRHRAAEVHKGVFVSTVRGLLRHPTRGSTVGGIYERACLRVRKLTSESTTSSGVRDVSNDIAERPVHLAGLDIRVVLALARLGRRRRIEKVAERLALRGLHRAVVVDQRTFPDVERAGLDLRG